MANGLPNTGCPRCQSGARTYMQQLLPLIRADSSKGVVQDETYGCKDSRDKESVLLMLQIAVQPDRARSNSPLKKFDLPDPLAPTACRNGCLESGCMNSATHYCVGVQLQTHTHDIDLWTEGVCY